MGLIYKCLPEKVTVNIETRCLPGVFQGSQHQWDQWVSPRWLHLLPPLSALAGCPTSARAATLWGSPGPPQMGPHCRTLSKGGAQSLPRQARPRACGSW
ncbi:KLK13 isoform 5 [Pan troglodytes]|uniref:Kallikrein 13 splice variant 7 n=5 Tax=Homininae TaxID=207598 RepID=Q5BQ95_HUMAN|nr:kallikrein 13 splice variant 7 [Homo sapiens]PNI91925.1 KLK13 isoform 4 [Pan troglodytes]AAX30056.1 kallikrein 13 splice variant 8 [Homo sapiens]KAI2592640.1 kallikrein related peptidase 13 [Homo sapiens]KAI2592641.1 kallikrein related peptidase 13 [Homo sapiens]